MKTQSFAEVLHFWFPDGLDQDQATLVRQWVWWFRGGADADIMARFAPLLEQARWGELNAWADEPQSRLALIIVLDQFSRSLYRGTAEAFAQDAKACALAIEGINVGHYAAFKTPWEKTFFFLPLGHSEDLKNQELAVQLATELLSETPPEYRDLLEFSAEQAHRSQDVITKFGRQPHRNEVLGRQSTSEEQEYLAVGQFTHTRPFPPHLAKFLSNH